MIKAIYRIAYEMVLLRLLVPSLTGGYKGEKGELSNVTCLIESRG